MRIAKQRSAMTLVELMIVMAIIGLLSAILIPSVKMAIQYRENSLAAHHLRTAIQAFELYRAETGGYPPDVYRGIVPSGMGEFFGYFNIIDPDTGENWWVETTEIGGKFDWENHGGVYSISIPGLTIGQDQLEDLDKMIDDGNLAAGNFRWVENRYHYILEE